MRLVLDASVCLKWYLSERTNEAHSDIARAMLSHAREGRVKLRQPAIWQSEIAAVLAREMPTLVGTLIQSMQGLQADIVDDAVVMLRAIELSVKTNHHLFDTIYHAVAFEYGIDLITADEHYYRKARAFGSIVLLKDWRWKPQGVAEPRAKYIAKPRRRRTSKKS